MELQKIISFWPILLVLSFLIFKFLKFKKIKNQIPEYINLGGKIVDVRTEQEFYGGNNPNSLNIPLNELNQRHTELDKNKPVILCCASGTRSAMAAQTLKNHGFKTIINAGPWKNTIF